MFITMYKRFSPWVSLQATGLSFAFLCLMGTITLGAVAQARQVAQASGDTPAVTLADKGQASLEIHIAANASDAIKGSADTLADYLGRISGGNFKVLADSKSNAGIALGLVTDFPSLKLDQVLTATGIVAKEQYLLRSHKAGLYVIGQSETAVQYAMWDLLYHLGYRQFFPGDAWEIIPQQPALSLTIDSLQSPDYLHRKIWYGYGLWNYNAGPYAQWQQRNRLPGTFKLNTGHAYNNIIRSFKSEFEAHPEYYALVKGKRTGSKMCASNPGVQKIVLEYAKNYFEKRPDADCISIDPSDGGNWCECEPCAKIGTVSDRALFLANVISEYLENNLPDKYVAMYAYNDHSPPPTIQARERVIINVATSFLRDGYSTVELLDAWRDKGVKQLGIREYYSVNPWDRDLPGRARGSNLDYLTRTITDFHRRGVVFLTAESSDNWGPNGLGYYLASRMLWDVDEAKQITQLKQDFYDKAFGEAASTMQRFYETIDGSNRPVLSSPLIGKMYRLLGEAMKQTDDSKVRTRLDQLILYTRYVELYRQYSMAGGKTKQETFESLIRHSYRMRETMMVHAKGLYRDLDRRDKSVEIPKGAQWNVSEAKNPWKSSEPFSRDELDTWVSQGDANNPPLTFEPVSFEGDLVRASDYLDVSKLPALNGGERTRGKATYYFWADRAPMTVDLQVTGGMIAHYRDRGPTELRLYIGIEDQATLIDEHDVANDGKQYAVALKVREKGLHVLTVNDNSDLSQVIFPQHLTPTVEMSSENASNYNGRSAGYFYVPKGTSVVGGFSPTAGATVHDASGQEVLKIAKAGYFQVPVAPEQDGKLWSVRKVLGRLILMTVPPFIGADAKTLLVPDAILKKDSGK